MVQDHKPALISIINYQFPLTGTAHFLPWQSEALVKILGLTSDSTLQYWRPVSKQWVIVCESSPGQKIVLGHDIYYKRLDVSDAPGLPPHVLVPKNEPMSRDITPSPLRRLPMPFPLAVRSSSPCPPQGRGRPQPNVVPPSPAVIDLSQSDNEVEVIRYQDPEAEVLPSSAHAVLNDNPFVASGNPGPSTSHGFTTAVLPQQPKRGRPPWPFREAHNMAKGFTKSEGLALSAAAFQYAFPGHDFVSSTYRKHLDVWKALPERAKTVLREDTAHSILWKDVWKNKWTWE